jgi:hypothetical protein
MMEHDVFKDHPIPCKSARTIHALAEESFSDAEDNDVEAGSTGSVTTGNSGESSPAYLPGTPFSSTPKGLRRSPVETREGAAFELDEGARLFAARHRGSRRPSLLMFACPPGESGSAESLQRHAHMADGGRNLPPFSQSGCLGF